MKSFLLKSPFLLVALLLATALSSCEEEDFCSGTEIRSFPLPASFSRVSAGENFRVTIRRGDSYSLSAEGCRRDLDDLGVEVRNGELTVDYYDFHLTRRRVDLTITLPDLTGFAIRGSAEVTISGFEGNARIRGSVSGSSDVSFTGSTGRLELEVTGSASLSLSGSATKLDAEVKGSADLRAYAFPVTEAVIHASGSAEARVMVTGNLYARASGSSDILYRGNPLTDIATSGSARVKRE